MPDTPQLTLTMPHSLLPHPVPLVGLPHRIDGDRLVIETPATRDSLSALALLLGAVMRSLP